MSGSCSTQGGNETCILCYEVLVRKSEGKGKSGRTTLRREYNIKKSITDIGFK
jgi:hypothetical protein